MTTTAGENDYDELPYPKWTHRDTHPRQLEAIATLFGMRPAPITDCRVLEIGCASGSNLAPMAQDLPGSTFVGFDLSAVQIAEARSLAGDAGIENVRFEHADILNVDDSWGRFDYIVCHGIYSWVPNDVREKILAICKNNLAADGVALVSYNVYPGWHFRRLIRDMMLYHVSGNEDPHTRITQARAALDFLLENCPQDSAYATVLRAELAEIKNAPDAQIFHEYLERVNDPFYFHDFATQLQSAGLQYLGDVQFSRMLAKSLPQNAQDALTGLPIIRQEQYMDFLHNRTFRRTLLCHDDVALDRNLRADIMREFQFGMTAGLRGGQIDLGSDDPVSFKLGGYKFSSGEPVVKAAVKQLASQWPDTMSFSDLHAAAVDALPVGKRPCGSSKLSSNKDKGAASTSEKTLAYSMMTFLGAGLVHAWVHPPKLRSPLGEKPVASSLVRAQARRGKVVSNFRHEQVLLNDTEHYLIGLLDGEHDREVLIGNIRSAIASGAMVIKAKGDALKEVSNEQLSVIVNEALARLHGAALLES
jgi:methyltransferase-like protein